MRRPALRSSIRQMMIVVAVVSVGAWTFAQYKRGGIYYASGWWDAECELSQGNATIYGSFGRILDDICCIDQETGLPIAGVLGCVIRHEKVKRVEGHNDHIAQYFRWHGLPKNTLKPWEKELFHLKRFFDDQSRTDGPKRLRIGGPAVVSPDGRNSVRLAAGVKADGSPDDSLKVVIAAGNVVLGDWYLFFKGDPDLFWGPVASRLVVIRSVSDKTEHNEAYDPRTGPRLREETWYEGKRRDERLRLYSDIGVDPYER